MPDRGAVSKNLLEGGTYTIPAGYHNGSDKVPCAGSSTTEPTIPDISYTSSSTSYTISMDNMGYFMDIIINSRNLTVWRVIQKNANGTVDVVSESVSSNSVVFTIPKGNKNYIGELNEIASSYENNKYAVSSRNMGYDVEAEAFLTSILEPSVSLGIDDVGGNPDSGYKVDEKLVETIIGTLKTNRDYLLVSCGLVVSRLVINGSNAASREYYVKGVSNGKISLKSSDDSYHFGGSVRLIVVLKAYLKIIEGNGTESSPYTLGV